MNQEQPQNLNIKFLCSPVMLTFINKSKAVLVVLPKCCYAQPIPMNPILSFLCVLIPVEHFLDVLPLVFFCSMLWHIHWWVLTSSFLLIALQERIIERLKEQRERDDRERLEEIESFRKENKDLKEKVNALQAELTEKEVSLEKQMNHIDSPHKPIFSAAARD